MPDDGDNKPTDESKPDEGKPTDEGTETPTPTDSGKEPEFDGEFDQDRAKRLVTNLRTEKATLASKVKALEAQIEQKGGSEKTLQERFEAMEARLAKADHDLLVAKVIKECQVPDDLVEFLTAKDEEGLKTQAERLASHAKRPADEVPGKPKPRLRPGQGEEGDGAEDFDPKKVAAAARRR